MTQKDVIQRILTELVTAEVITDDNHDLVKMYLQQAYGAGFDAHRLKGASPKSVTQYDLNRNPIKIWESVTIAAHVLNLNRSGIAKCARGEYATCGGYVWKYIDPTTSASVESIESTRLESIQPEQGTHVSKISSV